MTINSDTNIIFSTNLSLIIANSLNTICLSKFFFKTHKFFLYSNIISTLSWQFISPISIKQQYELFSYTITPVIIYLITQSINIIFGENIDLKFKIILISILINYLSFLLTFIEKNLFKRKLLLLNNL